MGLARRVLVGVAVALVAATLRLVVGGPAARAGAAIEPAGAAALLNGVACVGASFDCVAVGGDQPGTAGYSVPLANGVPGQGTFANDAAVYFGVACPGASCIAVGTSGPSGPFGDEGVTAVQGPGDPAPTSSSALPGTTVLYGIACLSASMCIAVGTDNGVGVVQALATDGSAAGNPVTVAGTGTLFGIACASPTACLGVGRSADGSTGVAVPITSNGLGAVTTVAGTTSLYNVTCPGSACLAAGKVNLPSSVVHGVVVAITIGGSPGPAQQATGTTTLIDIACATASSCVAAGWLNTSSTSSNATVVPVANGVIGAAQTVETGGDSDGIACPETSTCVVVGEDGAGATVAFVTAQGSPTGVPPPPPPCQPGPSSPAPSGSVSRLSGSDRDHTAIAVSDAAFPATGSAAAVVLASDATFPDALAGTPLAVAKKGPLLLTPPSGLPPAVAGEISRVLPAGGTVYILGGDAAVSGSVDGAIQAMGDVPQRIAGANRFATAVDIASALGDPAFVLEATGTNFPDALSAGAAAAANSGAVLLTDGDQQAPETAAYLAAHQNDTATAVGGPASNADPNAASVSGPDRYATAVQVALNLFSNSGISSIGFASGVTFPDALSGGARVGAAPGPMLLVPPCGNMPSSVANFLSMECGLASPTLYGGPGAVGDDILAQLDAELRATCG